MKDEIQVQQSVIGQYQYEMQSWLRLLSFFQEEIVYFKHRLSEIVTGSLDDGTLQAAESFQDEFLSLDKINSYLSEELKKQNTLLEKNLSLSQEQLREMNNNQQRLRKEIKKAEEIFMLVKENFVAYLVARF